MAADPEPTAGPLRSHMILTPIPHEHLLAALDRFMAGLTEPLARAAFRRIRATSTDRAAGAEAERHRLAALNLAAFAWRSTETGPCRFNWDGTALNAATESYVILHEAAHFVLAPPERRGHIESGLGPGPDTIDQDAAMWAAVVSPLEREEDGGRRLASRDSVGGGTRPAGARLVSRSELARRAGPLASAHFTTVLKALRRRGLLSYRAALAASA